MAKVTFSTAHAKWPYQRQTPKGSLAWGNNSFFVNEDANLDYLVVYDEPHKPLKTLVPKARRILFISEPPTIKTYRQDYLNQFGLIVTPTIFSGLAPDSRQLVSQLALPWHYGVKHSQRFSDYKNYDALKAMEPPAKKNEVSVMISTKAQNEHHRRRIQTTHFLKKKLGDKFHLLGRGFNEVDDKAEGIDPYAFHLVCENNDLFWTEKLADAYLGWAFPVFSGCETVGEYFPAESFIAVDLEKPQEVLQTIERLLADPDFYQKRLPAIAQARNLVMDKYNLFATIDMLIKERKLDADDMLPESEIIFPQPQSVGIIGKVAGKAKNLGEKVIRRAKNLPFILPWYFRVVNRNPAFFTDYYDRLGKYAAAKGYYGQRGQDWFLDHKVFQGKANGVFLDVGANDPKELSNTLFFEEKGWTGLAFEPQERFRERWKTERKTECLPYLLGAREGEDVTFVEYDTDDWQNALSGVQGYALEKGINLENLEAKRFNLTKRRLDNVLREKGINKVDFMSLDVEGFEMEVLQGIDFDAVRIHAIVVENDRSHIGDNGIRKFLKSKGYKHIARLSGDDVFQRKHS